MRKVLNFAAFQAAWFASVLGAAAGQPALGPVAVTAWIALHVRWLPAEAGRDLRLAALAGALGWAADSVLVLAGLVEFPAPARLGGPSPLWMAGLWAAFAMTLRHALGWLRGHAVAAAALGAAGGPLAYLGGEALGAIALAGAPALAAVSLEYALATPALLAIARHLDRERWPNGAAAEPGP